MREPKKGVAGVCLRTGWGRGQGGRRSRQGDSGVSLACPEEGMSTYGPTAHVKASDLPRRGPWLIQQQGPGGRRGAGTLKWLSLNLIRKVLRTIPDALESSLCARHDSACFLLIRPHHSPAGENGKCLLLRERRIFPKSHSEKSGVGNAGSCSTGPTYGGVRTRASSESFKNCKTRSGKTTHGVAALRYDRDQFSLSDSADSTCLSPNALHIHICTHNHPVTHLMYMSSSGHSQLVQERTCDPRQALRILL